MNDLRNYTELEKWLDTLKTSAPSTAILIVYPGSIQEQLPPQIIELTDDYDFLNIRTIDIYLLAVNPTRLEERYSYLGYGCGSYLLKNGICAATIPGTNIDDIESMIAANQ